jgi:hypothetical protein
VRRCDRELELLRDRIADAVAAVPGSRRCADPNLVPLIADQLLTNYRVAARVVRWTGWTQAAR